MNVAKLLYFMKGRPFLQEFLLGTHNLGSLYIGKVLTEFLPYSFQVLAFVQSA